MIKAGIRDFDSAARFPSLAHTNAHDDLVLNRGFCGRFWTISYCVRVRNRVLIESGALKGWDGRVT